jgi:hypothetical protein
LQKITWLRLKANKLVLHETDRVYAATVAIKCELDKLRAHPALPTHADSTTTYEWYTAHGDITLPFIRLLIDVGSIVTMSSIHVERSFGELSKSAIECD